MEKKEKLKLLMTIKRQVLMVNLALSKRSYFGFQKRKEELKNFQLKNLKL